MAKSDRKDWIIWDDEGECFLELLDDVTLDGAKRFVEDQGYVNVSLWAKVATSKTITKWEDE